MMLKKSDLRVIKGGLSTPKEIIGRRFLSSFATNTRLMGVVGLYISWEIETSEGFSSLHQYFYYDAEEYGIETYKAIYGNNIAELYIVEQTLIGGLGGDKVELLYEEACFLLQSFALDNERLGKDLPGKLEEYKTLLEINIDNKDEISSLVMGKICGLIESDYQLINYFLMRCFAKDYNAARYLLGSQINMDLFPELEPSTLCKNSIKKTKSTINSTYYCQSLIEDNNNYQLVITKIYVKMLKVVGFERSTTLKVSSIEAGMLLSRPEYITLYDMLIMPENIDELMAEATDMAMMTIHENGKLYLAFNKNNSHVNKKEYMINDDVYGVFFLTDMGQLIVGSYSKAGIASLEKAIKKTKLKSYLELDDRYEFKEPVLYEFVNSDFLDFLDFIYFIRDD